VYNEFLSVTLESAGDERETVMQVLQAIVWNESHLTEMMDELCRLCSGIVQ
jgi:hypothetical protein